MKKYQLLNLIASQLRIFFFIISTAALLTLTATADIQNGGFESGDYSGWTTSGTAWGNHPTNTDMGVGIAVGTVIIVR